MSGEYDSWKESKNELPPLGEVIEGTNPKDFTYSHLGRDFFALVKIKSKLIWITPLLNEMDDDELKITHWRRIAPDPKGYRPFVKIEKSMGYWEPKIVFKKEKNDNNNN